jgi:hypothetical protein
MSDRIKKAVQSGNAVALDSLLESDPTGLNHQDFVSHPPPPDVAKLSELLQTNRSGINQRDSVSGSPLDLSR